MKEVGSFWTFEPDSSWIAGVIYDRMENVLILKTKSDKLYKFDDVPADVVEAWSVAESAGSFFHENIKGTYHEIKDAI
jgi:hypothetical protein